MYEHTKELYDNLLQKIHHDDKYNFVVRLKTKVYNESSIVVFLKNMEREPYIANDSYNSYLKELISFINNEFTEEQIGSNLEYYEIRNELEEYLQKSDTCSYPEFRYQVFMGLRNNLFTFIIKTLESNNTILGSE